jgi:hypothetical protein
MRHESLVRGFAKAGLKVEGSKHLYLANGPSIHCVTGPKFRCEWIDVLGSAYQCKVTRLSDPNEVGFLVRTVSAAIKSVTEGISK